MPNTDNKHRYSDHNFDEICNCDNLDQKNLKVGAVRTWRSGQMRAGPIEEVAEGEVGQHILSLFNIWRSVSILFFWVGCSLYSSQNSLYPCHALQVAARCFPITLFTTRVQCVHAAYTLLTAR